MRNEGNEVDVSTRVDRLREEMRRQEIGLALILGHENMFYYSNYKAIIYSRQIIITVDEKRVSAIVPGPGGGPCQGSCHGGPGSRLL